MCDAAPPSSGSRMSSRTRISSACVGSTASRRSRFRGFMRSRVRCSRTSAAGAPGSRRQTLLPRPSPRPLVMGLAAAFAQLRERDCEVLRLVAWEGLSLSEAAVVLGRPAVACGVRFPVRRHGWPTGSRVLRRLNPSRIASWGLACSHRPGPVSWWPDGQPSEDRRVRVGSGPSAGREDGPPSTSQARAMRPKPEYSRSCRPRAETCAAAGHERFSI
jgi:hypothetical protein